MNSLQRTISAIQFESVDKLPVSLHNFLMCAKASNMDFGNFFKSGNAMAQQQINLWHRFNHDVILLENGTAALAEALGCQAIYRKDQPPAVQKHLLNDISEVNSLKSITSLENCSILQENLKATEIVSKQLGKEVFIMGRGDQGPFSLAALLLGIDNLMIEIAMGENLNLVHKLLDFCTNFIILYCKEQIEHGAHCTSIGDSTAGPDLISPEAYKEFAFPYEKRVVDSVHQAGGLVSLHICGNSTKIIGQMVLTDADILEIDEKTDLSVAKEAADRKCTLLGQVSPGLIRNGSADQIKISAQRGISIMGRKTGYILGPGCALASDTPIENIEALISARDL